MPKKKTHNKFLMEVYERYGNEYTILGKYKGTHDPIKIKHNKCNNIWSTTAPYDFLKKNSNICPKCSHPSRKKTNKQFLKEVYDQVGNEYKFLEKYIDKKTPILVKHNKCKFTYKVKPNNFLSNKIRCPKCNKLKKQSRGIKKIIKYLKNKKIKYILEYPIEDKYVKRNDQKLKFDIFINSFNLAIEFDGRQHFMPIKKFGGIIEFNKTKKRDKRKNEYCKENNINLLRISYLEEENIIEILNTYFRHI